MSDGGARGPRKSARAARDDAAAPAAGRYRIQTVARETGLGLPLLRAWERRYALLSPARSASGYREYSDDDVRVLRHVRRLIDAGLGIGEVARIGRAALLAAASADEFLPSRDARAGADLELVGAFVRAVERGDVAAGTEAVARAINSLSLRAALSRFVCPSMAAVGEAWARGAITPGVERVATALVRGPLESLLASANTGLGAVQAVCAPAPGDEHEIGALTVALELARGGVRALHLGGRLDAASLADVATLTGARLVCLSYTAKPDAKPLRARLAEVRERVPARVRVTAGGSGIAGMTEHARRAGVEVPADVDALVALATRLSR